MSLPPSEVLCLVVSLSGCSRHVASFRSRCVMMTSYFVRIRVVLPPPTTNALALIIWAGFRQTTSPRIMIRASINWAYSSGGLLSGSLRLLLGCLLYSTDRSAVVYLSGRNRPPPLQPILYCIKKCFLRSGELDCVALDIARHHHPTLSSHISYKCYIHVETYPACARNGTVCRSHFTQSVCGTISTLCKRLRCWISV